MKYIYATLAILSILAGVGKLLMVGASDTDGLLLLVFSAICAVAAEIAELPEKLRGTILKPSNTKQPGGI